VQAGLHDCDGVVVKYGWDILGGKLVCSVGNQQARLADSTVADDDAPRKVC
jgi:hypothetical protein